MKSSIVLIGICLGLEAQTPKITAALNAATFAKPLAFASLVSIFGSDLATTTVGASSLPLPTTMAGVSGQLCDVKGPTGSFTKCFDIQMVYVSPQQINVLLPDPPIAIIGTYTATIRIVSHGVPDSDTSAGKSFPITLYETAPGIFRESFDCVSPDSCSLAPTTDTRRSIQRGSIVDGIGRLVSSQNPLVPDVTYSVFFTGMGLANAANYSYIGPSDYMILIDPSTKFGVTVWPSFMGRAPGFPGLYQANFDLPPDIRRAFGDGQNVPKCSTITGDLRAEMQIFLSDYGSPRIGDGVMVPILAHPNQLLCNP